MNIKPLSVMMSKIVIVSVFTQNVYQRRLGKENEKIHKRNLAVCGVMCDDMWPACLRKGK